MVSAWKHIKIVMRKNACELQIPFRPAGLVRVSSVYGGDNILFIAQSYHFFLSLSSTCQCVLSLDPLLFPILPMALLVFESLILSLHISIVLYVAQSHFF